MPDDPTPTLTDEQQEELASLLMRDHGCILHNGPNPTHRPCRTCSRRAGLLVPLIARMVADAEQRGRAEISAAVEAVLEPWRQINTLAARSSMFIEEIDAALTDPAAAVARIKAEERERVVSILSGPFDGTEGFDSFTLGQMIARLEGGDDR